jgi:chromosome segregation protein
MNRQRISELDDLEERTKAEIAQSEAAVEMMREELGRDRTEADQLRQAVAAGQAELAERRRAIDDIEARVRALRKTIEDTRVRAVDLAREKARHHNELSAIGAQRQQLERQDQRLLERTEERRRQLEEAGRQAHELAERRDRIGRELDEAASQRAEAEAEAKRRAAEVEELAERIHAARSELAGADSRRELLADLEAKREGLGAGVVHLMEARSNGAPEVAGIHGVVAEKIDVDVEHAAAIEAALGDRAQAVVAESFRSMADAIRFLAREQRGKAAFLARDALGRPPEEIDDHAGRPGVVGRAVDLVRRPEAFDRAVRFLLGNVLVVRDLDTAQRLAAADGRAVRYATLDGQLLDPRGVSVGGIARGPAGVISRRSELRALDARRAAIEADLEVLGRERAEVADRAAAARRRIEQLAERINAGRAGRAEAQAELGKSEELGRRLRSEIETNESERAEITATMEMLGKREGEVRRDAAALEESERALRAELAGQERRLAESEEERDEVRARAAELEVAQAQRVEKAEGLRRRVNELGGLIAERKQNVAASRDRLDECGVRRREAHETILAKKRETAELLERRGRLGTERAQAANRRETVRVAHDGKRDERNTATRQAKELDARLNQLNVHATEVAMRIENLEGRTESEYDCSLAEALGQDEAEERDWDAVTQEIEAIHQKMRSMGSVNTYAIEELEELKARAEELRRQREDLEKAERTLKEIIRKINRRSRELFQTTFDNVREHFQVLFRKLFGGGRADVVLEEDVDILDAGIDIVACPPGKEPSSITLLSGGERALTAIALLFAIFRSKPSPFCILDEVDAALDESNIERFCSLVREFLRESQFLVVTHSRRTMSMADALYGITMQEPGVSTKVAVKFEGDSEVMVAG